MKKVLILLAVSCVAAIAQTVNGVTVVTSGIELNANKDAASGYAGLTAGTLLKTAEFPAFLGDATSSAGAVTLTVVKINGTTVTTNAAADQFLGTTASAVAAWVAMPNCQDSAGNHINYNTTTHAFSCGTTSSGGTVTSVTGTANQIASTGGTTPVISLPASITLPGIIIQKVNTVSFSATPTFDLSLGNVQKITLTSNVTSSTASNHVVGERVTFLVCQDASGSRTFVWPTTVKGAPAIGSTLSTCTSATFMDDGTNLYASGIGVTNM